MRDGRPDPILNALAVLLGALVIGVVLLPHVAGYFFLFDDFALVGIAAKSPIREFFSTGVGGFYRPVALCGAWLETLAFGWKHPAGYAAVSAALHLANSFLAFLLLRRLGQRREPALLGAGVFLLSPWAGEAFFWASSQFDLFSFFFSFLALWLAFRGVDGLAAPRLLVPAVFLLALGACLSKEMAVTLPGLFLVLRVWRQGFAGLRSRALVLAAAMAAASAASLFLRSRVIDALGGAYGSLPSLFKRTDLAATSLSQLRAFAFPAGGAGPAFEAAWAVPLVLLIAAALVTSPRKFLAGALGLALSMAPVVWSGLEKGSTAGGRYLYLPGFFVALVVSLGFSAFHRAGWSPLLWKRLAPYPAVVLLAAGLAALVGQQRLWQEASRLSRQAIGQVDRERGDATRLHIQNLPFSLREGPFVLKSYAFRFYFQSDSLKVRSTAVTLTAAGKVTAQFSDPFSEYPAPHDPATETSITLR